MKDRHDNKSTKHERCVAYVNKNGLIYVCGRWKGHYGRHKISISWDDKDCGND